MNKKYFIILIIFVVIFAYAIPYMNALAVNYELSVPIPGESRTIQEPPQYILMLFRFSLAIAGLLALGMIIFGAIQYTTSAGNVSRQQDAKDRITSAIYGIILLVGATLILTTINPDLALLKWEKPAPITSAQLSQESLRWGDIWKRQLEDLAKQASRAHEEAERLRKEKEQALAEGNKIKAQELFIAQLEQNRIADLATSNRLRGEIAGTIAAVLQSDNKITDVEKIIMNRLQDWADGTITGILFSTVSGTNNINILISNTDYQIPLELEIKNTLIQQQAIATYWENTIKEDQKKIAGAQKMLEDLKYPQQPAQQQIKEF